MKISNSTAGCFLIAIVIGLIVLGSANARDFGIDRHENAAFRLAPPDLQERVHKTGNVHFMVTNYGTFGNLADASIIDPETGLPGPSCQYPAGSGLEYLFLGALWLGAVVNGDTLASLGQDGWLLVNEMFPDDGASSNIVKRSNLPASPYYDPNAISEADYIAIFYDTLTNVSLTHTDPYDNRPHHPLGLKIIQESYSWSANGIDDFIIIKELLVNIGSNQLTDLYAGLYFDGDVGYASTNNYFFDDITGSVTIPADAAGYETPAAWITDNDGDPFGDTFNYRSPTAVVGVAVIESPAPQNIAYNWWITHGDETMDWGPRLTSEVWPYPSNCDGTPEGDRNKYYLMKNNSRDYDQVWAAVNKSALGWIPPHPDGSHAANIADGWDTKFLLSFGLEQLAPGDSCEFVFVVAMGDGMHRNPRDFSSLFSAQNPLAFSNALDLTDLKQSIQRARLQYRLATTGLLGDANSDLIVNISDAIFLIQYLFNQGAVPERPDLADVNADCEVSLPDVVYIVNFIFAGGPYPMQGCAAK